jgi:hypothetical protein
MLYQLTLRGGGLFIGLLSYNLKAFGKPAAGLGQQLADLVLFALTLPWSSQAHGCSPFERLRLLTTSQVEGPTKTGFQLSFAARRQRQEQFPFQLIGLHFVATLSIFLCYHQRLSPSLFLIRLC